ncbi:hypothetical protein SynRS9909_00322 [Synechococcus sp. RS9909]|nr:hypothetical protein SynRS9909_00322 [Synechococcus sp. RS9909]
MQSICSVHRTNNLVDSTRGSLHHPSSNRSASRADCSSALNQYS